MPATRCIAIAIDVTSMTTCVQPAARIFASASCSICGVGVVYDAGSLRPGQRSSTVPITPGL